MSSELGIERLAILVELADGSVHQVYLPREAENKILFLLEDLSPGKKIRVVNDPITGIRFWKKR